MRGQRDLLTTAAAAVALLGMGLAACGSDDGDDSANARPGRSDPGSTAVSEPDAEEPDDAGESEGSGAGRPSETRQTGTTAPPTTAPSPPSDVGACSDLVCEITVTEGMEIPADGAVGITLVSFPQVDPETVEIRATGPGIELGCSGTPGPCTLNGVAITVTNVRPGTAVVSFTR